MGGDVAGVDREAFTGLSPFIAGADPVDVAVGVELRARQGGQGCVAGVYAVEQLGTRDGDLDAGHVGEGPIGNRVVEAGQAFEVRVGRKDNEVVGCVAGGIVVVEFDHTIGRTRHRRDAQDVGRVQVAVVGEQVGHRDDQRLVDTGGKFIVAGLGCHRDLGGGDGQFEEVGGEWRLIAARGGEHRHHGGAGLAFDFVLASEGLGDWAVSG